MSTALLEWHADEQRRLRELHERTDDQHALSKARWHAEAMTMAIRLDSHELPFERTPDDIAGAASEAVRLQLGITEGTTVADHVVIKALAFASGPIRIAGLLHDFQLGVPDQPPLSVAQILFLSDGQGAIDYGKLVSDAAAGADQATREPIR